MLSSIVNRGDGLVLILPLLRLGCSRRAHARKFLRIDLVELDHHRPSLHWDSIAVPQTCSIFSLINSDCPWYVTVLKKGTYTAVWIQIREMKIIRQIRSHPGRAQTRRNKRYVRKGSSKTLQVMWEDKKSDVRSGKDREATNSIISTCHSRNGSRPTEAPMYDQSFQFLLKKVFSCGEHHQEIFTDTV